MVNNSLISRRILELIDIIRKSIYEENGNIELKIPEHLKKDVNNLRKSIIEDLVWSPGTLIHFQDKSELEAAKATIDLIWDTFNIDEIFEEITSGGCGGLLVNIIGDYIDRAKMLKPTLVTINPENYDFHIYFKEAMNSWLFGLNNASLILCCSLLENILIEELRKINKELVYKIYIDDNIIKGVQPHSLETLINIAAEESLFSFEEKKSAHKIRRLRNNAIHGLRSISSKQTYNAIINTKNIVEKLLSETDIF